MKYRLYHSDYHLEIFANNKGLREINELHPKDNTGHACIPPYVKTRLDWIQRMLSAPGITINISLVPTVKSIGEVNGTGHYDPESLFLPKAPYRVSRDGKIYILLQDEEKSTLGWSVFLWGAIDKEGFEILHQDTRANMMLFLLEGEWIRSFGVDYERVYVEDLDHVLLPDFQV